jgi:hypothetical protein
VAGEEPQKNVDEMTVAELRSRAGELEITGRSGMNKSELRQAVVDAEDQIATINGNGGGGETANSESADGGGGESASGESASGESASGETAGDGGKPASEIPAPSIGPNTKIEKEDPEERLARHEQSEVDAMGLDKRRQVMGQRYGASFAKQATIYGIALAIIVGLFVGAKIAVDELDKGPEVAADKAPWSQPGADQRPPTDIDFPHNPSS